VSEDLGGLSGDSPKGEDKKGGLSEDHKTGDWRDALGSDLKGSKNLEKFKSVEDLAKGYENLSHLVGTEKIPAPKPEWREQEWNQLYDRLGRPDSAKDYNLGEGWSAPDGFNVDDRLEKYHKAGLNNDQAKETVAAELEIYSNSSQARKDQAMKLSQDYDASLREKYGLQYGEVMDNARKGFKHIFGDDASSIDGLKDENGVNITTRTEFVERMAKMGGLLGEDGIVDSRGSSKPPGMPSPAEARLQIDNMTKDRKVFDILNDTFHPDHADVVARWEKLHIAATANDESGEEEIY